MGRQRILIVSEVPIVGCLKKIVLSDYQAVWADESDYFLHNQLRKQNQYTKPVNPEFGQATENAKLANYEAT